VPQAAERRLNNTVNAQFAARQSGPVLTTSRHYLDAAIRLGREEAGFLLKKEYDFSKLKELKNQYAGKKKAVGIHLSPEVVDDFKALAAGDGTSLSEID